MKKCSDDREDLGLGLKPGDPHYRAYVGPPGDYDLIAAMSFNLLTTLGLRQHHSLLDVGCGSLRIARLLIPYLNRGKYFGIEPNEWLVEEGIRRELGQSLVEINLQSLRTRSDQRLAIGDFARTGTERRVGCDVFNWRGRLTADGLDLSRMREISASYIGARSRGRKFTIRNSRLETSAPDMGPFCCATIRFKLVQG